MKTVQGNPERQYGIDLLRMISMGMIVVIHTLRRSQLLERTPLLSVSHEVLWAVEILCYGAVNCFVLISGYVGWKKEFRASRILGLWLQVLFYSLGFELLYQGVSGAWSGQQLWQACFPAWSNTYWFFTQYFVLCFLMPFLNRLIRGQSMRQNRRMIAVLLFFLSGIAAVAASPLPVVGGTSDLFSTNRGYGLLWFVALYLTGAVIGRWKTENGDKGLRSEAALAIFFGCHLGTWIIRWAAEWIQGKEGAWYAVSYTAPFMVAASIALLLWSTQIKPTEGGKRVIAFLSPGAFGVYLIHSNPRVYPVYVKAVEPLASMGLGEQAVWLVIIGASVFIVCSIVDIGRNRCFRWLGVPRLGQWLDKKVNYWLDERGNHIHGPV